MRYYLYISDAKVDMLYPQIAQPQKRKISTEYKLDLKVVSAGRKSEEEPEAGRITRLDAVCDFIREYSDVGNVDAPAEYIDDSAAMRWGPLIAKETIYPSLYERTVTYRRHSTGMVFFGCQSDTRIIALHGSMRHILGPSAPSEATYAYGSSLPVLDSLLKEHAETGMISGRKADSFGLGLFLDLIAHSVTSMTGPLQNLSFLAKRLADGCSSDGRRVMVATPLYVALVD